MSRVWFEIKEAASALGLALLICIPALVVIVVIVALVGGWR